MVNPKVSPKPGKIVRCLKFTATFNIRSLLVRLINLIEHTAISKMSFLCFLPVADNFCQSEQLYFRKLAGVLLSYRFCAGPVIAFRGNFLALWAVQIFQVGLRDGASSLLVHD